MNQLIKRLTSFALFLLLFCGSAFAGEITPVPAMPPPPEDPLVLADSNNNATLTGETDLNEITLGEIIDILLSMYSVSLL